MDRASLPATHPSEVVREALRKAGLEPLDGYKLPAGEVGFWVAGHGERFWVSVLPDLPLSTVTPPRQAARHKKAGETRGRGTPVVFSHRRYEPIQWGETATWVDQDGQRQEFTPARPVRYVETVEQKPFWDDLTERSVDDLTEAEVRQLIAELEAECREE